MVEQLLENLRRESLAASIPIMDDDSLQFLTEFVSEHGCRRMLEVGTAVGYSTVSIAAASEDLEIVTLEVDPQRHRQAVNNIAMAGLSSRITAILADARQYETDEMFDIILLDGPKAHNSELLHRYERNLREGGYFIIDDVYFHGFIEKPHVVTSRRLMRLVKRFQKFQEEIENNDCYECTRINLGDGLLIARKKENVL